MTTTLRPSEPLQHAADGARSRRYEVCVNSRPVGAVHLGTDPGFGASVGADRSTCASTSRDRRRGRGTVAALAAEEVLRGWGCRRGSSVRPGGRRARACGWPQALGYIRAQPQHGQAPRRHPARAARGQPRRGP